MNYPRLLPTLLGVVCLSIALAISCKQSSHPQPPPRCESLQEGMRTNNINEVKTQVSRFIERLPSQQYTAENINKLVSAISGDCGATVDVPCFNCIKTDPGQTEIIISFATPSIHKAVDISYNPSTNIMKVITMHD